MEIFKTSVRCVLATKNLNKRLQQLNFYACIMRWKLQQRWSSSHRFICLTFCFLLSLSVNAKKDDEDEEMVNIVKGKKLLILENNLLCIFMALALPPTGTAVVLQFG